MEKFYLGNDARVVSYMRWEDAVIPGKTITAEFAVHTPGPTPQPSPPGIYDWYFLKRFGRSSGFVYGSVGLGDSNGRFHYSSR